MNLEETLKEISVFLSLSLVENGGSIVDKNWICWKFVNGNLIGKRCVSSKDGYRYTWLEDVEDKVHSWLCGEDADYYEVFNIEDYINSKNE